MRAIKTSVIAILAIGLLAGSAVGVAAQDEVAAPVEFTTKWFPGGEAAPGVEDRQDDGSGTHTGLVFIYSVTDTTDPRVDGAITGSVSSETYPGSETSVMVEAHRIVNDGGAWQEVPVYHLDFPWPNGDRGEVVNRVFVGEGGYEGWTIVGEETWSGGGPVLHGIIVEAELLAAPEPWVAE